MTDFDFACRITTEALQLKFPNEKLPSESTIGRVMKEIGVNHSPRRKPNGITKAERKARKSDDLLKRDFQAEAPCKKCITDITEISAKDGKLYVSAIFDCLAYAQFSIYFEDRFAA